MYATHMESSAAAAARKADVMSSSTVFDPICRGLAQELENRNGVCVSQRGGKKVDDLLIFVSSQNGKERKF